jgi:hypothetical protein
LGGNVVYSSRPIGLARRLLTAIYCLKMQDLGNSVAMRMRRLFPYTAGEQYSNVRVGAGNVPQRNISLPGIDAVQAGGRRNGIMAPNSSEMDAPVSLHPMVCVIGAPLLRFHWQTGSDLKQGRFFVKKACTFLVFRAVLCGKLFFLKKNRSLQPIFYVPSHSSLPFFSTAPATAANQFPRPHRQCGNVDWRPV